MMTRCVSSLSAIVRSAVFLGLAIAVSGCSTQNQSQNNAMIAAHDYSKRHPIIIDEQPEVLDLPIGQYTRKLNKQFRVAVSSFAAEAKSRGNGAVEIQIPSGGLNEAAAHAITPQLRTALKRGGVALRSITVRSYPVEDADAEGMVRLSYVRMKASVAPCGNWPDNLAGGLNSAPDYENYGCATQSNLAAMIDNPADLIRPRKMSPVDQMRRKGAFENSNQNGQQARTKAKTKAKTND